MPPARRRQAIMERRAEDRRDFRKARRAGERIRLLGVTLDLVRLEEIMHHVTAHIAVSYTHLTLPTNREV